MNTKRDTQKLQNERHQLIIQELLRDEDNKYCVDCDAKGPRWASWNIGIFLCIRCAGIHRNLGVHISKVKSVNLDSWTAAQLANMRDMGNSRARAIYEARLPDNYRRPQTDSALETFIRAKYEHKRYIMENYVSTPPDVDSLLKLLHQLEQSGKKRHVSNSLNIGRLPQHTVDSNNPNATQRNLEGQTPAPAEVDLLGLNSEPRQNNPESHVVDQQGWQTQQHPVKKLDGLLTGDIFSTQPDQHQEQKQSGTDNSQVTPSNASSNLSSDLLGLDLIGSSTNMPQPVCQPAALSPPLSTEQSTMSTKDSILALYSQSSSQSFGNSANSSVSCVWPMTSAAPTSSFVPPPNNQFGVFQQATPVAQHMNVNQVCRPQMASVRLPATWNTAYGGINQHSPAFVAPVQQVAHEAYLSQVNNQLASLQLGGRAVHHQS